MATVAAYSEDEGMNTSYRYDLVNLLNGAGYVKPAGVVGGAVIITVAGKPAVQQLHADRAALGGHFE